MKNNTKRIILYTLMFVVSLLYFVLFVFIFQAPNGIIGCLLCMISVWCIITSIIKLFQYTTGRSIADAIIDAIIIVLFG